jgi:hypothetical protein
LEQRALRAVREVVEPLLPSSFGPRDGPALVAAKFLEEEVERAVRYDSKSRDLMGSRSRIGAALVVMDNLDSYSQAAAGRFLQGVSMLRQVLDLGISFYDYTGDELINEVIGDYEALAARMGTGIDAYVATAERGGLVISGGSRKLRRAAADAIHRVIQSKGRAGAPFNHPQQFYYVEAEDLYAMRDTEQEEVRRRMLVTPPWAVVFGTDDLDEFIEETPRRVKARIVTYLFMDGQNYLNLNDPTIHVSTGIPSRPQPTN